jgi:hypothetical protein
MNGNWMGTYLATSRVYTNSSYTGIQGDNTGYYDILFQLILSHTIFQEMPAWTLSYNGRRTMTIKLVSAS